MEDAYWRDIGTLDSCLAAHLDYLAGRLVPFELDFKGNATATLSGVDAASVIGENSTIKPGVEIVNSVLGPTSALKKRPR